MRTFRTLLRNWLGITEQTNNLLKIIDDQDHGLADLQARVDALESSGLADIRSVANLAQSFDETDPRRRALSDATNDYLVRKAKAEAQVRQHFGYGPEITKDQT